METTSNTKKQRITYYDWHCSKKPYDHRFVMPNAEARTCPACGDGTLLERASRTTKWAYDMAGDSEILSQPAPAIKFAPSTIRKALAKIKLIGGGGTRKQMKEQIMCIQQAHNYVLGHHLKPDGSIDTSYHPACSSEVITEIMVQLNDLDFITDAQRAMLKKQVVRNINTAPLAHSLRRDGNWYVVTDTNNRKYKKIERKREDLHISKSLWLADIDVPLKAKLEFVNKLADMGRFDEEQGVC